MSQTKYPKLTIRNRNSGSVLTGANTLLSLDEVPLTNVTFLKLNRGKKR